MCYNNGARRVITNTGQFVAAIDMYGPDGDICYHATNDLIHLDSARVDTVAGGEKLEITLSEEEVDIVCPDGSTETWTMDVWTQLITKCSAEIGMTFNHIACDSEECP